MRNSHQVMGMNPRKRRLAPHHFREGGSIFPSVVRLASLSLMEALSTVPLALDVASVWVRDPSVDSPSFLGARALLARRRAPLSLGGASSGPPFTLSCRCDIVLVMPGALDTGEGSAFRNRDEEATVLRAKLGTVVGVRGALGTGGGREVLGSSSSGVSGSWGQQILFSSGGFCRGTFLRGLALGLRGALRDCGPGGSLPGRALMEPLARGSRGSSGALRGDVSEVPFTELRRDQGGSEPLGASLGGGLQPPEARLPLEMGTTLRMLGLSQEVKVRTGLAEAA